MDDDAVFQQERERARERTRRILNATLEDHEAMDKEAAEELLRFRNEEFRGRDLVAEVLSHPDPRNMPDIATIRDVLFNISTYICGKEETAKHLLNDDNFLGNLEGIAAVPDGEYKMPALIDPWKFVYCNQCYIKEGATLDEVYQAQLHEEALQTPKERAKERIRSELEKAARRNAKWVIPVLERLSPEELSRMDREEEGGAALAIWKQVSPAPPIWIQNIIDSQHSWGFVFYKSPSVEAKYGRKWNRTRETIRERTFDIEIAAHGRNSREASIHSIHSHGHIPRLLQLWTEIWATVPDPDIVSDDEALRRHFREYRETLSSPGILRNTFLVVDPTTITRNTLSGDGANYELFWLWAYDANWDPSDSITAHNGEVYQGRMKVLITCLDAWFYAARWEGVSLKDMWLRAQSGPENIWICYTTPMQAWDHEPYV